MICLILGSLLLFYSLDVNLMGQPVRIFLFKFATHVSYSAMFLYYDYYEAYSVDV